MTTLSDKEAIHLLFEEVDGFEDKFIPYLGWYWRDWTNGRVSFTDGQVAIDQAAKWEYPATYVSDEDHAEILRLLAEIGRAKQRILAILETYRDKVVSGL